jgi:hypothetical protein
MRSSDEDRTKVIYIGAGWPRLQHLAQGLKDRKRVIRIEAFRGLSPGRPNATQCLWREPGTSIGAHPINAIGIRSECMDLITHA